jgi:hypothetical protein
MNILWFIKNYLTHDSLVIGHNSFHIKGSRISNLVFHYLFIYLGLFSFIIYQCFLNDVWFLGNPKIKSILMDSHLVLRTPNGCNKHEVLNVLPYKFGMGSIFSHVFLHLLFNLCKKKNYWHITLQEIMIFQKVQFYYKVFELNKRMFALT